MFLVQTALWMVQISWLVFIVVVLMRKIKVKDYEDAGIVLFTCSLVTVGIQFVIYQASK